MFARAGHVLDLSPRSAVPAHRTGPRRSTSCAMLAQGATATAGFAGRSRRRGSCSSTRRPSAARDATSPGDVALRGRERADHRGHGVLQRRLGRRTGPAMLAEAPMLRGLGGRVSVTHPPHHRGPSAGHAVEALTHDDLGTAARDQASRRVPTDLLDELSAAGCSGCSSRQSRRCRGRRPSAYRMFETLAPGRCLGGVDRDDRRSLDDRPHGASRPTFDRCMRTAPTRSSRAIAPTGLHQSNGDGRYRVTGRWGFVSGSRRTQLAVRRLPRRRRDEAYPLADRLALAGPGRGEDTWTASAVGHRKSPRPRRRRRGPRSTPSLAARRTVVDATVAHISAPSLYSTCLAAFAVGIAHGALDDIGRRRRPRCRSCRRFVRDQSAFQLDLANAPEMWSRTCPARSTKPPSRCGDRRVGPRAHVGTTGEARGPERFGPPSRALSVVEIAYRAGGGTADRTAESALQRRLRDIHARHPALPRADATRWSTRERCRPVTFTMFLGLFRWFDALGCVPPTRSWTLGEWSRVRRTLR